LGPLRAFTEIDTRSLQVRGKLDEDDEVDLRLFFLDLRGKDRQVRIMRWYDKMQCDRVASAVGDWIEKHRSDRQSDLDPSL
jgi:hypothetical protein